MIVAAWPRSGGTKFCIDLSEKTGLPFIGELKGGFVEELGAPLQLKKTLHEAKHGDVYTIDQFFEYTENPDKYVILGNDLHWSILKNASIFVFRKNPRNTLTSLANMMCKTLPVALSEDTKYGMIMSVMRMTLENMYISVRHYEKYGGELVWYEEYFNNKPTNTVDLDRLEKSQHVYGAIDHMISSIDINERLKGICNE